MKRSSSDATVVGIVSYSNGCGTPGYYDVYTDVYTFLPWIQSVLTVSSFEITAFESLFFWGGGVITNKT